MNDRRIAVKLNIYQVLLETEINNKSDNMWWDYWNFCNK